MNQAAIVLLAAALLPARSAFSQLYAFHVKGDVQLKAGATAAPLRPNDAVRAGQALVLKAGSQVVLINQAGENISYTKPGTASYAALQGAFETAGTGTGRAYLAYVWQSMNKHATPAARQANAPLGGVARGQARPLLAPADSAVLEQPLVVFQWQPAATETTAWLTITEASGDPVLQLRTTAAEVAVHALLTRLRPNTVYYWTVSATPESAANTPRRAFVWADAEALERFGQEVAGVPPAAAWQQRYRKTWFFTQARAR